MIAPVPWPPPFTHFPERRGDFLAGQPIPYTPTPEAVAGMKTHEISRRVKALRVMWRQTRRLCPEFCEAAHAEAETLVAEILRRARAQLAKALGGPSGARAKALHT